MAKESANLESGVLHILHCNRDELFWFADRFLSHNTCREILLAQGQIGPVFQQLPE